MRRQAPPVWEQAAEAFSDYVSSGGEGDVLVFMPGGFEICQTIEAIRHAPESKGFILLPLHGELPPRDQDAAVARYDQRKVVVATNVAETSLTIDGVRLVIDSGLARIPRYDANRGINTLLIEKISQANADQRAGRAGRTAPGVCMRLWSREEHDERAAAGIAGNQTARSGRSGADAEGRRRGGFEKIPLAGEAGRNFAHARGGIAGRIWAR